MALSVSQTNTHAHEHNIEVFLAFSLFYFYIYFRLQWFPFSLSLILFFTPLFAISHYELCIIMLMAIDLYIGVYILSLAIASSKDTHS